jgi:hypothetical protein
MAGFTPSKRSDYGGENGGGMNFLTDFVGGVLGVAGDAASSGIEGSYQYKSDTYAVDEAEETNRILGALGFEADDKTRELVQTVALIAAGTLVTLGVIGAVTWKASQA